MGPSLLQRLLLLRLPILIVRHALLQSAPPQRHPAKPILLLLHPEKPENCPSHRPNLPTTSPLPAQHHLLLPRNVVRLPGGCNLVQILHRLLLILGRGIADRH